MCVNRPLFFLRTSFIAPHLVFDVDSAKTIAKKAKAPPKNRLPSGIWYRRSRSHFNYYLIPRDEHVAARAVSVSPARPPLRRRSVPFPRSPLTHIKIVNNKKMYTDFFRRTAGPLCACRSRRRPAAPRRTSGRQRYKEKGRRTPHSIF